MSFLPDSIPSRLKSIDTLRGAAALAVVLSHAVNYGDRLPEGSAWFSFVHYVLNFGYLGVPLFFVISGFCIHLQWSKQYKVTGQSEVNFTSFWLRRLRRLYPPYFVVLCLSMALVVLAYILGKEVPLVMKYPEPRPLWMILDFSAHATMLHGFHPIFDLAGGNPPFWTLAREEYFYLLYPLLLLWRQRFGLRYSLGMVLAVGLLVPFLAAPFLSTDSAWWRIVITSAFVLWIQWCFGMAAAEAYHGLIKLPRLFRVWWAIPFWGFIAYLCDTYFQMFAVLAWGLTFFTLLNYCIETERAGRWADKGIIKWLAGVGIFSYSLYLIHSPVRSLLKQCLGSLATTSNPVLYLVATFILTIAGYYAGKIFFTLVESRFLNSKRRITTGSNLEILPDKR